MARDRDRDRDDDESDRWADDELPDANSPISAARLARAKARVKAPAIVLIIHAALMFLTAGYNTFSLAVDPVAKFKADREKAENDPALPAEQKKAMKDVYDFMQPGVELLPVILPVSIGVGVVVGALTLFGAVSLLKLSSSGMAKLAAGLAIVPCFGGCCLLGIGGGIWSFSAMKDADVKAAFAAGGKAVSARDDRDDRGDE